MSWRYEPVKHTGTRKEVILGLMREWWDIQQDGAMRMHAQERETRRIEDRILGMGLELRAGAGVDEGWLFAVRPPHGQTCDDSDCFCEPEFKVWHEEGFEDGVGRWEQQDVYETVEVGDPRYVARSATVGTTCFGMSVGGPWYTTAVTGKEWVWVGPPSPVPVPKPQQQASQVAGKTFATDQLMAVTMKGLGSPSPVMLPDEKDCD